MNLKTGEASTPSWTHGRAILAEAGSLSLEFLELGSPFDAAAKRAMIALLDAERRQSPMGGLFPTFIQGRS